MSIPPTPTEDTVATQAAKPRLRALDGLRLVAALMVVYYHWFAALKGYQSWGVHGLDIFPTAIKLAPYGWLGVNLFFVISGFVIAMSCVGRSVPQFFRSRVQRLYPAYWVCLAIAAVTLYFTPFEYYHGPSVSEILVNLTMLQNGVGVAGIDSVYWTLYAELRFYALFAIVVVLGVTYRNTMAFCLAWTFAVVILWTTTDTWIDAALVANQAPFFIVGIALFLLHRYGNHLLTWGVLGVNFALCSQLLVQAIPTWTRRSGTDLSTLGTILIFGLCVLAVWMVAAGLLDWMTWRWLTVAGVLTYPLYLLHNVFGRHLLYVGDQVLELDPIATTLIVLAIVLLASYAVHRLVELPMSRWLGSRMTSYPKD